MKLFISVLLVASLPIIAFSQGLEIGPNAHIIVNGDAFIMVQDGNFVNHGNFVSDASIVVFLGNANSSDTQIKGDSITNFHQLIVNKNTNGIQLGNAIEVDDSLKMTSGDLDLNSHDIDLGNTGILYGESNTNRIWGAAGGEIIYVATLNAPASYHPANMGLELSSSQNLGLTTIKRGHVRKTSITGYGIERYFDISPTNNTNLDASLVYHYYENELGGIAEAELDLWKYDGSNWDNQGGVLNTADNTLTKTGIPSFSVWTAGSVINNPLPVELLYFKSDCSNQGVRLSWATATEKNSNFFTIERSKDGEVWDEIGEITAQGNSLTQVSYEFMDEEGGNNLYYYRLLQTDLDLTTTFFNVIQANCQEVIPDFLVNAFPNPTREDIHLQVTSSNEAPIEFVWYSAQGKLLAQGTAKPNQIEELQLGTWASGVYILMVSQGENMKKIKIMKQ